MSTQTKCFCKHCRRELEPIHKGKCPYCGKTGKAYEVVATTKLIIRTSIKITQKRKGFKRFLREMLSGWRPSKSSTLPNGVDYQRTIDKEKDEYHQVVTGAKTGKIIHEEHEALSKHK